MPGAPRFWWILEDSRWWVTGIQVGLVTFGPPAIVVLLSLCARSLGSQVQFVLLGALLVACVYSTGNLLGWAVETAHSLQAGIHQMPERPYGYWRRGAVPAFVLAGGTAATALIGTVAASAILSSPTSAPGMALLQIVAVLVVSGLAVGAFCVAVPLAFASVNRNGHRGALRPANPWLLAKSDPRGLGAAAAQTLFAIFIINLGTWAGGVGIVLTCPVGVAIATGVAVRYKMNMGNRTGEPGADGAVPASA